MMVNLETVNICLKNLDNNQNSNQGHSVILERRYYKKRENLVNFALPYLNEDHVNQREWPM